MSRRIKEGDYVYRKGHSIQAIGLVKSVCSYDEGPIGAWVFWFDEGKEMHSYLVSSLCLCSPLVALAMQAPE